MGDGKDGEDDVDGEDDEDGEDGEDGKVDAVESEWGGQLTRRAIKGMQLLPIN